MTTGDALYAAVLDRPGDDTPRLLLADWLDDTDEPERAAFIRAQVGLARFGPRPSGNCRCDGGGTVCGTCRDERDWDAEAGPLVDGLGRMLGGKPTPAWMVGGTPEHRLWSWCVRTGDVVCAAQGGVELVVRRGFVAEVRLPIAAFVGGECGTCAGRGGWAEAYTKEFGGEERVWRRCPPCDSTGRLPGLARELFAAHPIERVVLTDREPMRESGRPKNWHWTWETNGRQVGRAGLPRELMRTPIVSSANIARIFASRDDALAALSTACVAVGRKRAGLRPLT